MTAPGPGSGTDARAMLVDWYAIKPEIVAEDYVVVPKGESVDGWRVGQSGTLQGAVDVAQEWIAAEGGSLEIVHLAYTRVAIVGEVAP